MEKSQQLSHQKNDRELLSYFCQTTYLHKTIKFETKETNMIKEYLGERKIEDIDFDNIDNTWDDLLVKGYKKGDKDGFERGIKKCILKTIQKFPNWTDGEVAELVEVPVEKVKEIRKSLYNAQIILLTSPGSEKS